MAESLKAVHAGYRYQALLFWQRATELLLPDSSVVEVRLEDPAISGFDDVVVRHHPPLRDGPSEQVEWDHSQAKYHVSSKGAFSIDEMTNPEFIGASSRSVLSSLGNAYRQLGSDEYQRRLFWLVSPWTIHPNDKLFGALWRDNTRSFRLDVLQQGKRPSSQWVKLRAKWREAIGVGDDDELCAVLARLRLEPGQSDLNGRFASYTSALLRSVGLKDVRPDRADCPYPHLPWTLYERGQTTYTKDTLHEIAHEYGLLAARPATAKSGRRLGIRTAVRWGDHMEATTAAFLALEEHFAGRFIREDMTWAAQYAEVRAFLRAQVVGEGPFFLDVGAVTTIAFAAGYAMPTKDGRPIYPIQRRRGDADIWDPPAPDASHGGWTVTRDEQVGPGEDVALGLAVAQPVWDAMIQYAGANLPAVGRVVELSPEGGPGARSVAGAGHALFLAEEARAFIRQTRLLGGMTVHLFIAAPNGLTFMLGQEGERLGRCQLYEFDFGGENDGSYRPSLLVPDHTR